MSFSISGRAGFTALVFVGVAAIAVPARSDDTINSLSEGAACRDKDGIAIWPHSAPPPPVAVQMTPFGMIQVVGGWNNRDCYFYVNEVGLKSAGSTSCPEAAVGQEKSLLAGTRGLRKQCSK
jgi:hypothetical protein